MGHVAYAARQRKMYDRLYEDALLSFNNVRRFGRIYLDSMGYRILVIKVYYMLEVLHSLPL